MKKRKLNYRFHNPNASKVEQAIQEAADELPEQMNGTEGHST